MSRVHDRYNTPREVKEYIKYLAYIECWGSPLIMRELGVTNRTIIFALREESDIQFRTRYYMEKLIAKRKEISKMLTLSESDINTMKIHYLLESLSIKLDELSKCEVDVYGGVLE